MTVSTSGSEREIRVLGPLEVIDDGRPVELGGARQRMVLAVLLLEANEVVSVDRLIEAVWGDAAGPRAVNNVHVYVSKLRKALTSEGGAPIIETRAPGYVIHAGDELDLIRFESLVDEARMVATTGDPAQGATLFRDALALWRGRLLSDLAHADHIVSESHRLEVARLAALADCLDCELVLGRHAEVTAELTKLVEHHPLDERFRGQLMLAHYRSGRHAQALSVYQEGRQVLDRELGLEPGPELQALEERILLHDRSLLDFEKAAPGMTVTVRLDGPKTMVGVLASGDERWILERAVTTIGRRSDRTIVLRDTGVSRTHAEVRRVGTGYSIVDVGSLNGISVNGRPVIQHDLHHGDRIQIGERQLVFELER